MPASRSIRNRKRRRRVQVGFELQLTSMMDMLIILVIFLLKSYASTTSSIAAVKGLELPVSTSQNLAQDAIQVIITPEGITFENQRILDFVQSPDLSASQEARYEFRPTDLGEAGRRVIPLYDALSKARQRLEILRARAGIPSAPTEGQAAAQPAAPTAPVDPKNTSAPGEPFKGVIAIQADKRVNYEVIRKVMFTGAEVGFTTYRFLAKRQGG